MAYLSLTEARTLTRLSESKVPDEKLELLLESSTQIIDNYVLQPYETPTALVKLVTMELVLYLSKDKTLLSEQLDEYSYKLNDKALTTILSKLEPDRIANGGTPISATSGRVRGGYI